MSFSVTGRMAQCAQDFASGPCGSPNLSLQKQIRTKRQRGSVPPVKREKRDATVESGVGR